jgi:ATP-dependent Clp protease ATP-binding subunit ClpA
MIEGIVLGARQEAKCSRSFSLVKAEQTPLKLNFDRPSPELIDRNPSPGPSTTSSWREKQFIGQRDAVSAISKALRRSRADLKDPRHPIGSFIFLGTTGVGETFLARPLAEFMFGDTDALIQIDMSDYMEKFIASRLIGSPPGYVGYEEGGQF